jgi:inosine/xanthosine triphosphatase
MENKKIIVASKNPVKIQAALEGFESMFKSTKFLALGLNTLSGVPDQPIGNEETFRGAMNRALNAFETENDADYWIGIEGGNIRHSPDEMEAMAWVVVINKNKKIGKARTAGFFLPKKVIELIDLGYELGHADEIVFGVTNTKQKMGSSGLLTDNALNRTEFYVQAVILALIPFLKTELF